jgi:signal transduction histidine kinase
MEKKSINIHQDGTEGLACVADRDSLHTIMNNLIENAVKYSPEKSILHIDRQRIENGDGAFILIGISDEGPGIPEEKHQTIFEQFERIKNQSSANIKGIGLGLYIVHQLIQLHHGKIKVYNLPAKGCCFEVMLPIEQE